MNAVHAHHYKVGQARYNAIHKQRGYDSAKSE